MRDWQRLPGFHSMPVSQHKPTSGASWNGYAGTSPARRGRQDNEPKTSAQRHAAMTWAQRLKRVFKIDIETCEHCGSAVKVIACIEDPVVIRKILDHL